MQKNKKIKATLGIKLTVIGFILVMALMIGIFNFRIPLAYTHNFKEVKANILLWPLRQLSEVITYEGFGFSSGNRWGIFITYFLAQAPFILVVMFLFNYLFNFVRGLSTEQEVASYLQSKSGITGRIVGSLLGTISPFCSCSTIPVLTSMIKSGIPFSTLSAFLITSPMINETGFALMIIWFGWKIAFIYLIFGLVIGLLGSYLASWFNLQSQIKISVNGSSINSQIQKEKDKKFISLNNMHKRGIKEALSSFKKFWWVLILAMLVGSLLHAFVPTDFIKSIGNYWWTPLVLIPFGILLYLNIVATVPIVGDLMRSGLGVGPSLGFMMAVNTISTPEIIILLKLFKKKFVIFLVLYLLMAILVFSYIMFAIPDDLIYDKLKYL